MKTLLLGVAVVSCILGGQWNAAGQTYGTLVFNNSAALKITNALTGAGTGPDFRVGLYAALDGTTNEAVFTLTHVTNCLSGNSAGLFIGGIRPVPPIPSGMYGMIQIRVWEAAYGNSYEEAAAAPPMNGRTACLGTSAIMRIQLGGGGVPTGSLTAPGNLRPIIVTSESLTSFSINDVLVAEGSNGTVQATFTVTLLPPSSSATSIDFLTVDGNATAGSDYVATNGTLSFAAGQTSATLSVSLTPDVPVESDEAFYVNLTNSIGALIARAQGRCLITEVRLMGLSVDVSITFNTVAGHHYVVEKSDDFVNWSAVTGAENVTGTGGANTIVDHGGGCQPSRMYRARLLD